MASATTVVIVRPEYLASIRTRLSGVAAVTVISESDSLHVLDAILAQPPDTLIMHAAFATTPRGATVVGGLKTRAHATTTLRVFIEDEHKAPLILAETTLAAARALQETSRPLDRAGTRQAARYPMNRRAVVVNGDAGQLIDLSVSGAQVQVPTRLRPSQVVRLVMPDETVEARCQATVAWSVAVPSGGTIHYRAGVEFVGPDAERLSAYCTRYGGPPDPTLAAK